MAVVTADKIQVHARGGLVIPFSRRDATGVPIDISGDALFFVTGSGARAPLAADPNNATGRKIVLTEEEVREIGAGRTTAFAVVDEGASPDVVLWSGKLTVEGF